jgi:hypothetical protein
MYSTAPISFLICTMYTTSVLDLSFNLFNYIFLYAAVSCIFLYLFHGFFSLKNLYVLCKKYICHLTKIMGIFIVLFFLLFIQ